MPLAKDQKLAILPWSPLAGGLLSGKYSRENEKPDGARRATFDFPPVERERLWRVLDVMRPIAARQPRVGCAGGAGLVAGAAARHLGDHRRQEPGAAARQHRAPPSSTLAPEHLKAISDASALPSEYPQWMLTRQSADRLGQVLGAGS